MRNGPDTAEAPTLSTESAHTTPPALSPSLWPAIIPPLVYAFGSVFVPYLGWLAGIALIATSRRWNRATKLLATLAPLVVTAIYIGVATVTTAASADGSASNPGGDFFAPSSPLMPTGPLGVPADVLFGSYVVLAATSFVAGIVLLAIALRRSDRATA